MTPALRCGLYVPNFGPYGDARTLAAIAAAAEAAGWDGCFIWDHVARPLRVDLVDPWIALAAMALATQRIRLGALVTPLARRRPWQVARATAALDRLSGGRLVFGAGSGSGRAVEWEDLGEPSDARTRAARLDEGLQVLAGLWSAAPFSFAGQHYRVHQACFAPAPQQTPRIPIWVAGHWPHPRPFARAARWDGVFPEFPAGGDELAQLRAVCAAVRAQRQTTAPFDVVYSSPPRASPGELADCAAAGATWWLARLDPPLFDHGWDASWPLEAVRAYIAQGPPVGAPRAGV